MTATSLEAARPRPRIPLSTFGRDLIGVGILAAAGLAAYVLLPDDLALLRGIAIAALLVLSLDLVVGYCGIATLGHAALYGAGAYAAGFACVRGLTDPLALLAVGAVAGGLAGLVTGAVILRATGLPQLVLSIATLQLGHEAANKAYAVTGGSDGLTGIEPGRLLGLYAFDLWGRTAYLLALAVLIVMTLLLLRLVRSPFGLLCRGIKEDRVRIRAMGASVFPQLLKMYAVSGSVAGLAGALAAVTTGVVGLDSLGFERSAAALVMLVLGGAGWLYGAVLGAVVFVVFEHVVSSINPFHWLSMVGALLILVVLLLPRGLRSLADRGEALVRLVRG